MVQALAAHPRLNFWLGPGCSAGLSARSDTDILHELRRTHPHVDQTARLEDTFADLQGEERGMFVHSTFNGMNWAYLSLAAMAWQDRAGAIVLRNIDGLLPRLLASRNLLPPLLSELTETSRNGGESRDSVLTLFELPVMREPARWRDTLLRMGAANPWVVAGVAQPRPAELTLLKEIAASGIPVYWVPLWSEPAPADFPMQVVPGFDPDSFLLALANATVGYLPAISGTRRAAGANPQKLIDAIEAIDHALHRESEALRKAVEPAIETSSVLLDGLSLLDDAAFEARLVQFHCARQSMERLAPSLPNTGGIELFHKAQTTGGRRADRLLELAAEEHRKMPVQPAGFRVVLDAAQWIRILHARAQLRSRAESQPFYEEAYRTLQSLGPKEPRHWQAAVDIAQMLSDWAATEEPAESEYLVREAVDVLSRPHAGGPLKVFEQRPLWNVQISLLRKHAIRLEGKPAGKYFDEARTCCERLRSLQDAEFLYQYNMGMIALEEARKNPAAEAERIATGNRHLQAAVPLRPESKGLLLFDWGTALASIGRERHGADADRLFADAYAHFAIAADEANASTLAHNNWSAFLLVQARKESGAEKERLLTESWTHARIAEKREPTISAYNLACVAAERGDWKTMSKWLRISARGPRLPAPDHTGKVTSFDPVRGEPWFQELLRELYSLPAYRANGE
jgi:hypothetical protein